MSSSSIQQPAAGYIYSTAEKVRYAAAALRFKVAPSRAVIAPFAGEFGYELMQWQGYVRALRAFDRQIHVITYPGRDYLYEGCKVHSHQIALSKAGYGYGHLSPHESYAMAAKVASREGLREFDIFSAALLCSRYHRSIFWRQEFRLFREPPLGAWDLAFHFRAVNKEGPDKAKNYPSELADELAARCIQAGFSTSCIGHPAYSYCAESCVDLRSEDVRGTVAAISSVHAVVGENSGPMHLANLCGKPTILWAQAQWRIDYSLRWNPFRVPIYVAANDTHQPKPSNIIESIVESFKDLQQKTDGFKTDACVVSAQSIASF